MLASVRPIRVLPLLALALVAPLALAHNPAGSPKNYCEAPFEWNTHDYGPLANGQFVFIGVDGNQAGDCNGDGIPGDYDGHHEWASGGAFLLAENNPGPGGPGTIACFNEPAHHPYFGPITVIDAGPSPYVGFYVAVDTVSILSTSPCGDNIDDMWEICYGTCFVTFPPGLDGSYHVRVGVPYEGSGAGTQGHVFSP